MARVTSDSGFNDSTRNGSDTRCVRKGSNNRRYNVLPSIESFAVASEAVAKVGSGSMVEYGGFVS